MALSIAFLLFGTGFFIYVVRLCSGMESQRHEQKMEERREFGIPTQGKRFRRKASIE